MKAFICFAALLAAAAAVEIILPGRALYEVGAFNAVLAAILVFVLAQSRRVFRAAAGLVARSGIVLAAFGVGILAVAAIANGLLAPSNHTIVGAPGSEVRVAQLGGALEFPLTAGSEGSDTAIALVRADGLAQSVRDHEYIGTSILRMRRRTVVFVQAYSTRGATLTITQPNGRVFLSPVLMMQLRQAIGGLNLPFDSFALPAPHRLVKAVLFTPREAAAFDPTRNDRQGAILFAVDDDQDRPLPNAIRVAPSGTAVRVGGVILRGDIFMYPAVEILSAPSMIAVIIGGVLFFSGLLCIAFGARPALLAAGDDGV